MAGHDSAEIGKTIDKAMEKIEKENKTLKGILPKNYARPELDKRRLGEVVDIFTNISMHKHGGKHGPSIDIPGRAYEYCLGKFAEQEGKLAGEFYTPACVILPESLSARREKLILDFGDTFFLDAYVRKMGLGGVEHEQGTKGGSLPPAPHYVAGTPPSAGDTPATPPLPPRGFFCKGEMP